MVTECSCHDPIVFGHGTACELGIGPVKTGGVPQREQRTYTEHRQEYPPRNEPEPEVKGNTIELRIGGRRPGLYINGALQILRR